MLAEIEAGVQARLDDKITSPKNVLIDEGHKAIALPGIEVIVVGGKFERVSQKYKLIASIYVVVTFKNRRSTEDRRKGIYPILEAIVACLLMQTFDLEIAGLVPKHMESVTEKEEADEGKVVFQLEFETSFVIEALSDEELEALLKVGLNYYLEPDDGTADATDLVTLGT
jgi:hypothetical protein